MSEIEKTCENCMYDEEPANGKHCRKCIHNATENFNPKMDYKMVQDIRNKAIDDFVEKVKEMYAFTILEEEQLNEIAEQLKAGK